jgi:alpha-tubulin suppressor-like RCC1 family protein
MGRRRLRPFGLVTELSVKILVFDFIFKITGHGDSTGRNMPSLVRDISNVGGVACGSAHTLAVSVDGKTVWSFGGGDNGKLGHGDTSQVYRPKVIEALQGLYVRKVAAGSTFSLALTSNGQVLNFEFCEKGYL